ncbi:MAG: type IV pilus twitching motility protein PilT [Lachnospiraceae bacterium]|nr:type IV pilus twitching motility protein PilT [Lachnospiraceae bacterium]
MVSVKEILEIAKGMKASDVHITVGVPPKIRVNGQLINMDFPMLSSADTEALLEPLMNDKQKETFRKTGEVDFSYALEDVGRYRVNIFRQRGSVAAALRIVASEPPRPEQLGLPPSVVNLYKKRRGLILVTGPTGSGKSTTLASLINQINESSAQHVITLEDPIEYLHAHKKAMVNQREVGMDTLSYANALRAALREDPDVILVGEMRDLETISTAVTAAETGHLVLSTLHTIGAASTIDRIIDVFPPHQQQQIRVQLSMVLESIISQQLIPTTSNGRVAAFEVLHSTPAIRNLIREGKTFQIPSMMQTNKKIGMQTMDDAIFDLFNLGIINRNNALNYSVDNATMEKRLGMI